MKTERFSKQSLFKILDVNEPIVIKAVYGSEEICIVHQNNLIHIQTNDQELTVHDKDALYTTLKNVMTQRYYIIQKSPTTNTLIRQFVTMHRNKPLSEWYIASKTKKTRTIVKSFINEIYFNKIQQISIRAATTLGESFPDCHTIVLEIACDIYGDIWIFDSILHMSNSKWNQYQVLTSKYELRHYMPNTDLLTQETFRYYLSCYNAIIVKPCVGQNGIGVLQISKKNGTHYEIHAGIRKIMKLSWSEAFDYIKKNYLTQNDYIVQQRIALATIKKCPIDIRVVTQKSSAVWQVTGKIVKVAAEQFFITNAAQKLLTLEQAIQNVKLSHISIKNLNAQLNEISLLASELLEENNSDLTIIGFDIGITENGDLWIIEGNAVPDVMMFKELDDKTMYKTIMDIKKEK